MNETTTIFGAEFLKNGFKKGSSILIAHKDEINALNVFPVPDGDTGHNMSACVLEACKELDNLEFISIKTVSDAIKNGTLMGARGNSGVILSQIFSGFCDVISKCEVVSIKKFVEALQRADVVAQSAVMKPVRGTILTLIEDLAQYAKKHENEFIDIKLFLERLTQRSFKVVNLTREMMPKLKQAGVVDAGAKGLAYIIDGFNRYAKGDTTINLVTTSAESKVVSEGMAVEFEDLTYIYCTEFMLTLYPGVEQSDVEEIKKSLSGMGDSMVIVHSGKILKGHIHTNHPGIVFEKVMKLGEIRKVKIDNMKEEHENVILSRQEEEKKERSTETTVTNGGLYVNEVYDDDDDDDDPITIPSHLDEPIEKETKKYGFISVSPGEGLSAVFKEMNVDVVVSGGQTMNPSTADISKAVEKINAQIIYVLPNNSNVILAAESAAKMTSTNEKIVQVLPTKSVQEGIAALIGFIDTETQEVNFENMKLAMEDVVSISVTHAVRDSEMDDQKIIEGETLFFADKILKSHGKNVIETIMDGFRKLDMDEYEILTIFYGADLVEEKAEELVKKIMESYPELETSVYYGGQQHYPYYISLE